MMSKLLKGFDYLMWALVSAFALASIFTSPNIRAQATDQPVPPLYLAQRIDILDVGPQAGDVYIQTTITATGNTTTGSSPIAGLSQKGKSGGLGLEVGYFMSRNLYWGLGIRSRDYEYGLANGASLGSEDSNFAVVPRVGVLWDGTRVSNVAVRPLAEGIVDCFGGDGGSLSGGTFKIERKGCSWGAAVGMNFYPRKSSWFAGLKAEWMSGQKTQLSNSSGPFTAFDGKDSITGIGNIGWRFDIR